MQIRMIAEQMEAIAEKLEGLGWIGVAAGIAWGMKLVREAWRRKNRKFPIWVVVLFLSAIVQDPYRTLAANAGDGDVWMESMEATGQFCRDSLTVRVRAADTGSEIRRVSLEMNGMIIMEETSMESGGYGQNWENTVTLPTEGDGEIRLRAKMKDAAGREFQKESIWICDQTAPELSLRWEGTQQEGYFSGPGTLCLMVAEKHFRPDLWKIVWKKNPQGSSAINWVEENGKHLCRIAFSVDGEYECDVTGKDPAGNVMHSEEGNDSITLSWVVDQEPPEIEVRGIQDKSHYGADVHLELSIADTWLKKEEVRYCLTGENNGTIPLETAEDEETIRWNPGMEEPWDDIYHLTAKACDYAGNETEIHMEFTVNRTGAIYGAEGVKNGETLEESPNLVITEKNLSPITECTIFCIWEGESALLTENRDYTVEEEMQGNYRVRRYCLDAGLFEREGAYTVQILSKDQAGNSRSNLKYAKGSLPITFLVDAKQSGGLVKKTWSAHEPKVKEEQETKQETEQETEQETDHEAMFGMAVSFSGILMGIGRKVRKSVRK